MLKLLDLFMVYGDSQFAELAVFLDFLKSLRMLHHQHHWQIAGANSYSDHLLMQRLYEGIDPEIDSVGEKTVALGSEDLVVVRRSLENMTKFLNAIQDSPDSPEDSPSLAKIKKSLLAERSFITAGEKLIGMLRSKNQLSAGVENLLAGILDAHETHVYLLQQRVKSS